MSKQDRIRLKAVKRRTITGKMRFFLFILILLMFLAGYWLKYQLGMNFFSFVSVSSYFPFKYFISDVLHVDQPGIVVYDDFDGGRIFSQWRKGSFLDHRKLDQKISDKGFGDNSKCLQISFGGTRQWVMTFRKIISAEKGDVFQLEGMAHLAPGTKSAGLRVAGYDTSRRMIAKRLAAPNVKRKDAWVKMKKRFTIENDDIRFIKLQLIGGPGVCRFDNLLLSKMKVADPSQ